MVQHSVNAISEFSSILLSLCQKKIVNKIQCYKKSERHLSFFLLTSSSASNILLLNSSPLTRTMSQNFWVIQWHKKNNEKRTEKEKMSFPWIHGNSFKSHKRTVNLVSLLCLHRLPLLLVCRAHTTTPVQSRVNGKSFALCDAIKSLSEIVLWMIFYSFLSSKPFIYLRNGSFRKKSD